MAKLIEVSFFLYLLKDSMTCQENIVRQDRKIAPKIILLTHKVLSNIMIQMDTSFFLGPKQPTVGVKLTLVYDNKRFIRA